MAPSTSSFVQPLSCRPQGIEAMVADTTCTFARHFHEDFGIGLIHRGAQKSMSGRGLIEAGPGDVITVNPGEVHDGAPLNDAGRGWRMLYLPPAWSLTWGRIFSGKAAKWNSANRVLPTDACHRASPTPSPLRWLPPARPAPWHGKKI